jgi:alkanesulfonate monooxygenase SsuD/methylene tetrahydromethanopterin reductase-like flavin-dependent oxidoreductase (luciferase family)
MNFLTSSVVRVEDPETAADFAEIQLSHVRRFRAHHPDRDRARVSQGLVVIPTDNATPAQRARYTEYARARLPRTTVPQGPARLLFSPDYVGTSAQLAERLHAHAAFREIDEVAFALPFTFEHDDYRQILTDIATGLGPALGWRPRERNAGRRDHRRPPRT